MITIARYADAMQVLKHPDMQQALYDAGGAVMADALITLHGKAHQQRRTAEFGVFTRKFFRHYEQQVFPAAMQPVLEDYLSNGGADLVELGYRVTMNLTADFAGIDRPAGNTAETQALLTLVKTFSTGATLAHSTLDPAKVNQAVAEAMQVFDEKFLQPSIKRRLDRIDNDQALPHDVLSTLLSKRAQVPLTADQLRREMAFFLQAGAHSTANSTVQALHELFAWFDQDDQRRSLVLGDPALLQRCVHESLRLHPASPVALRRADQATQLCGQSLAADTLVSVDLHAANRDPAVFGADADQFDPDRQLPANVWPFGLSFGYGTHACLGRDLDGGVVARGEVKQLGIVPMMVHRLLELGVAPDPITAPQVDTTTTRSNFSRYPVIFLPAEAH